MRRRVKFTVALARSADDFDERAFVVEDLDVVSARVGNVDATALGIVGNTRRALEDSFA